MSGVDAAVPTYLQPLLPKPVPMPAAVPTLNICTPTRPVLYLPQKLHAMNLQLAQHTQPYWPASDLPKSAQVSLCHVYHQSFLLTSPLYLLPQLHQVTPPPLLHLLPQDPHKYCRKETLREGSLLRTRQGSRKEQVNNPLLPHKDPLLLPEGNPKVPYYEAAKDQGAEPKYHSRLALRKNHYIESTTLKAQSRGLSLTSGEEVITNRTEVIDLQSQERSVSLEPSHTYVYVYPC